MCTYQHMLGMPNETCSDRVPLWLWPLCVEAPGDVADHVQKTERHTRISEFLTGEAMIDSPSMLNGSPLSILLAAHIVSWLS